MKTNMQSILFLAALYIFAAIPPSDAGKAMVQGSGVTNTTIQAAVDLAVNGNVVLVTTGLFAEAVLVSHKNITIQGQWDEAFENQMIGSATHTEIDGQNSYRPLTFVASSSMVERVYCVNGGGGLFNSHGGGVLIDQTSWVHMVSCSISDNRSGWAGGGIYVGPASHVRLTSCDIRFNEAHDLWAGAFGGSFGGGMFVDGSAELLDYSQVNWNTATSGYGGGVWIQSGWLTASNASFYKNQARAGATVSKVHGGGIGAIGSYLELDQVWFLENSAAEGGGALALSASTGIVGQVVSCGFQSNTAKHGGAFYLTNSTALVRGSTFEYNTASNDGGAVWLHESTLQFVGPGGGFFNNTAGRNGGAVNMLRSTGSFDTAYFGFEGDDGNRAEDGGAIFSAYSTLVVSGGCFVANIATNPVPDEQAGGGAIAFAAMSPFPASLTITSGVGGVGWLQRYTQCVFSANIAAGTNGWGGAVLAMGPVRCYGALFESNRAGFGAAAAGALSPQVFSRTAFVKNYASSRGGACYALSNTLSVADCVFSGNAAGTEGGALCLESGSSLALHSSCFYGNIATYRGGAIVARESPEFIVSGLRPPSESYEPPYSVSNGYRTLFSSNVSMFSSGGAIFVDAGSPRIEYSAFIGNYGAIAVGAHIHSTRSTNWITGSLFVESLQGDAITSADGGVSHISFCTIASNEGAGLRCIGPLTSASTISNSIVWDGTDSVEVANGAIVVAAYSDIEGWGGGSVIGTNPWFLANYHLRHGSPCINAGSPAALGGPIQDIDGEQNQHANYDMGFDQFLDTDGDHLPDIIETGTGVWVSDIDTGSDPNNPHSDGDGVDDGAEWIARTDPNDASSFFRVLAMWPTGGDNFRVRWVQGSDADSATVYAYGSLTGGGGIMYPAPPTLGGTGEVDSAFGPAGFLHFGLTR